MAIDIQHNRDKEINDAKIALEIEIEKESDTVKYFREKLRLHKNCLSIKQNKILTKIQEIERILQGNQITLTCESTSSENSNRKITNIFNISSFESSSKASRCMDGAEFTLTVGLLFFRGPKGFGGKGFSTCASPMSIDL